MTRRTWISTPPSETDGGEIGMIWALNRHSGEPALIPLRSFTPDVFSHWMRMIERKPTVPSSLIPRRPGEPASMAAEIREEIAKGHTNAEIADWLGCTTRRVANERRFAKMRKNRPSKRGTDEEIKSQQRKIKYRIRQGMRNCDIAKLVGCCESTVARHRARMLATQK